MDDLEIPARALWTCAELARACRVSVTAAEAMCRRGALPAAKCGRAWRIPRRAALEYLGLVES